MIRFTFLILLILTMFSSNSAGAQEPSMHIDPESPDYDAEKNEVIPDSVLTYILNTGDIDCTSRSGTILIVDNLPEELEFVSSPGSGVDGIYNPAAHAYVWIIGQGNTQLSLTSRVKNNTAPGTIITNSALAGCEGETFDIGSVSVKVHEELVCNNSAGQIWIADDIPGAWPATCNSSHNAVVWHDGKTVCCLSDFNATSCSDETRTYTRGPYLGAQKHPSSPGSQYFYQVCVGS